MNIFKSMDSLGFRHGLLWGGRLLKLPLRFLHRILLPGRFGRQLKMSRGTCILSRNIKVGDNLTIGRNSEIIADSLEIGNNVYVGDNVKIQCKKVILKDNCRVDSRTVISGTRTPNSLFNLGVNSHIYSDCVINTDEAVIIGDRTAAGGHCLIFTHGSYLPKTHGYPVAIKPVKIGDDTWLPWHAFILPGVIIGKGATVGAFSLVAGNVPDYSLAVGVPARIIKDKDSYRRKYNDSDMEKLCVDIIDNIVNSIVFSFKRRMLFITNNRSVKRVSKKEWKINEKNIEYTIIYTGKEEFAEKKSDNKNIFVFSSGLFDNPLPGYIWADLVSFKSENLPSSGVFSELWKELSLYGIRLHWWMDK